MQNLTNNVAKNIHFMNVVKYACVWDHISILSDLDLHKLKVNSMAFKNFKKISVCFYMRALIGKLNVKQKMSLTIFHKSTQKLT